MPGRVSRENVFSYETLVHALSGAAGSVVAMTTFFPLDTVRSRLQLEEGREAKNTLTIIQELIAKEGFSTLYRGIIPVLQSLCASNFVYFYTFHGLKILRTSREQNARNDLLMASVAGIINVLTTTPLWVVNTRLKMKGIESQNDPNRNNYDTLFEGLVHISRTEGVQKLWAGTLPSLLLVSNPAIQFMTYEAIKRRIAKSFGSTPPPALVFFVIGAIAKTVATIVTYPLQLAQTKLRHGHKYPDLSPKAGTLQILLYILKKQGLDGLYKGMEAKLLQTVLTAALMFSAYEKIAALVFRWEPRNEDETMSKGRAGSNIKFSAKIRPRSVKLLEIFPSAEISLYDYEAALSQPELIKCHTGDNGAEANSMKDNASEIKETTSRDVAKESNPKAVCFGADKQIPKKLALNTELGTGSLLKTTQKECTTCKTIVNESGEENEKNSNTAAPGTTSKELPKNFVTTANKVERCGKVNSSARSEKGNGISPKSKCSVKSSSKKKVINPSLLNGRKHSRIPRATTNARIPSRRNSKTSLGRRSFLTNRSKPAKFVTEPNRVPVLWKSDVLKRNKEPAMSITDVKGSKPAGTNSLKEDCSGAKITGLNSKECSKTQVGNAGDRSLVPSTTSVFRNLRLNNACRSCNDQRQTVNLQLSIHDVQDSWSDSKSSPEIRSPDPWSKALKMRPYVVESTSEEIDLSSEYSSDSMRPTKIKCFAAKPSTRSPISKSGYLRNSPRPRPRRRARFSFLNTLFDIVFWPFLFLRTNR